MIASPAEIEYFLEVYQTRHISRAAIRLGVTQPTLTVSLQKLEEKLGVKLFYRTKQGVVATPSGIEFFQKASQLVDLWSDVRVGLAESKTEVQGRFRVGCHASVGAYTLPILIENLDQQAPKIQIDLFHDSSANVIEKLVSFEIDLGFAVNPARHPDLVLKKMGNDRVLFWKKEGMNSVPKNVFANLTDASFEKMLGKTQMKKFAGWKLIPTVSLELIRTLTLSGLGVGIIPERVAKADGASLEPFDAELPVFQDKIFLAYRKEALNSRAGQALIKAATFEL